MLVVEDGTGKTDAESYASVSVFRAYCARFGLLVPGTENEELDEQALRRGTRRIDRTGSGARWLGWLLNVSQALVWPRRGVPDAEGGVLPSSPIPRQIIEATCEAAYRERISPGSLVPDFVPSEKITSATVGPISVDYAEGGSSGSAPVVPVLDDLLSAFLRRSAGTRAKFLRRA